MSIFLALLGLTAIAWLTHMAAARVRRPWPRYGLILAASAAILAIGLFDQTTPAFVPNYAANKASFQRHAAFGAAVHQAVPMGTATFELPLATFPVDDGQCGYDY